MSAPQSQRALRQEVHRVARVWLLLVLLLLTSLGSAYVPLGVGNSIAGLVIAAMKASLVVWFFMRLGDAAAITRIAIATAALVLFLLSGLSGVDYATRVVYRAPWQTPNQAPQDNLNRSSQ
jgi:cytochrome c oxidase subunit 4